MGEDRLKIPFREELNICFYEKFQIYKRINDGKRSVEQNQLIRARILNISGIVGIALSVAFAIGRIIFRA